MRRTSSLLAALALLSGLLVVTPTTAAAGDLSGPDLAGRWNSASLRMDDVGYTIKVRTTGTPELYDASVRMIFQDGRRGARLDGGLRLDGSRATLRLDGRGTMRGTLGQDGSLFFPTCYRSLTFATRADADSMCLFQELPR